MAATPDFPHDVASEPEVKFAIKALNALHSLRKKMHRLDDASSLQRSTQALERLFKDEWVHPSYGFVAHDPKNEPYSETRADCDASIAGDSTENLVIVETMKPIIAMHIRKEDQPTTIVVQKGVVVAQSQDELETDDD
jgi:hypothetical protein